MSYIDQYITLSSPVSKECSHLWEIDNYSAIMKKPGEKLRSVKFSAADDDFSWCLEHTVSQYSGRTNVSFQLRPCDDLRKWQYIYVNLDACLMETEADTSASFKVKDSFIFRYNDEELDDCGYLREIDIDTIKRFIRDDELSFHCHFTYEKFGVKSDVVSEFRVLSDLEKCFIDDHFRDVTISVKGKQYRAHKIILASRSSVFDKMLKVDMSESKNNHIDITDMDQETFEEMLYYIYTGMVKNLDELAFDLLPAADRYDLAELRYMCAEVLLKKLSTDNAVKILIVADMHRAEELKAHTLRFIKQHYEICEDFNDKEIWKSLTTVHDHLLKDMLSAFRKK